MQTIVVGVDGSTECAEALVWAVEEAVLRGARLHIVHAYSAAAVDYASVPARDFPKVAQRVLSEALGRANGALAADERIQISIEAVNKPPAAALVAASEGADLLVVASRGHGAFVGMVLGSVSLHCVSHATCPVVVVRSAPPTDG